MMRGILISKSRVDATIRYAHKLERSAREYERRKGRHFIECLTFIGLPDPEKRDSQDAGTSQEGTKNKKPYSL